MDTGWTGRGKSGGTLMGKPAIVSGTLRPSDFGESKSLPYGKLVFFCIVKTDIPRD